MEIPEEERDDSRGNARSVVFGWLMMICGLLGLVVIGLTGLSLGLKNAMLGGIIAFVPATFYLSIFLWLDRFDPEPPAKLFLAFAWGATVSVLFSGIVNDIVAAAWDENLAGIFTAPIIEEAFKGLGVMLIASLFRKDFDSVVDGIVYAGVVGLGFATVENIDYYGRSFALGGAGSLAGTFLIRGVLAPFSHVLFTCMTGIGCGISRETHHPILKLTAPATGFFSAMSLHSLWNTLASNDGETFLTGYLLYEIPLFLVFILLIVFLVRREGKILKSSLAPEVERGLITPEQLEIAVSVFRRTGWVAAAMGDSNLFNARRRFLRAVAKLGLCLWHKARASEARKDTGSFSQIARLQAEVFALRDQVG